jgi:ATP-dependent Lon protease
MVVDPLRSAPSGLGELGEHIPDELPILPLRDAVLFPIGVVPLQVGRPQALQLLDDVMRGGRLLGVVAQHRPDIEWPTPDQVYSVGTVARVVQLLRQPEGGLLVAVQGLERFRVVSWTQTEPYLRARILLVPDVVEQTTEVEALRRVVIEQFQRLVSAANLPTEQVAAVHTIEDPRALAYVVAGSVRLDTAVRQEILELDSVARKLERLSRELAREIEIMEVGRRIQSSAAEQLSKSQREYILREQLRAIRKELGEDESQEFADLRARLEAANLPEEARKEAERELSRLESLPAASPEHGIIRNYLDWLLSLPWRRYTGGTIDIPHARAVLDEDHYDLDKIKERILEYLAVRKLKEERAAALRAAAAGEEQTPPPGPERPDDTLREPILCFVGPPGVGKTSLAQSIARALGRKYVRISLGGVRDEAEIRGHRRTYIGAMPGRIIQGLRRAEAADPVFVLDEVDKLSVGFQGDPAAALLEVLDPAQNHAFVDNYLGVPFDLSRVMFITTANTLETVPGSLQDRMEVIQLAGYTEQEKLEIARRYLIPKGRRAHGLRDDEVVFTDDALRRIIREYTREAGVRNLEREIAACLRKAARELVEGRATRIEITPERVAEYLGRPRYFGEVAERIDRPGVATGLAWTPVGGDILFVEAAIMPGRGGRLTLTGHLGEVMRESAQTALAYLRSDAERLGIPAEVLQEKDVHVHVPAGAIPKDGPSAGITIATALASIATGRLVRSDTAMTGEITLRGKVLPVGGIKEKLLAAHRAGIRRVILPRRNERDLEDLPPEVREALQIILVDTVAEVLAEALEPAGAQAGGPQPEAASADDAAQRAALGSGTAARQGSVDR